MATTAICSLAFADALRPEPYLTVSQWADQRRIVGKPSPEPGRWRTDRVPYMREIMDNLSPSSPVEITAFQKAAQGAGTESALNAIGCWMDLYPDSILVVTPTTSTSKKFSRLRLDRMIEACPTIRAKVAPPRSRDKANTAAVKDFGVDSLILGSANSPASLRSDPIRYLVLDEVDAYKTDLADEGDPVELAIQRTASFRNRKIFLLSTPTVESVSHIHRWFLRGDQRYFFVPCPLCGHMQRLVWRKDGGAPGGVVWPKGSPELARYQCEKCGDRFEEWRKLEILPRGDWVASFPGQGGPKLRTYSVNALYYPYGWPDCAWSNLAATWEAQHQDPVKLKSFINLKLGEPWRDPTEAKADTDELMVRRESYGPELPAGAVVLTVGADVHPNRIEAELVAWGKDEENWSIDYRTFVGDTSKLTSGDPYHPSPWEELDAWLNGEWLSEWSLSLHIKAVCIDAGYQGQIVRRFCGERAGRRVYAIIGRAGQGVPVWPTKAAARRVRSQYPPAVVVGVDQAKEVVYARLKINNPGPGYSHFSVDRDRDYFDMLTSEICVPDYTAPVPKRVWRKKSLGSRNEALDARCYAYAALQCLVMTSGLRLNQEVDRFQSAAAQNRIHPSTKVEQRPIEHPDGDQAVARRRVRARFNHL